MGKHARLTVLMRNSERIGAYALAKKHQAQLQGQKRPTQAQQRGSNGPPAFARPLKARLLGETDQFHGFGIDLNRPSALKRQQKPKRVVLTHYLKIGSRSFSSWAEAPKRAKPGHPSIYLLWNRSRGLSVAKKMAARKVGTTLLGPSIDSHL
jgi:hypothetical protein